MKKSKVFSSIIAVIAMVALTGCNNEVSQDSITKLLPGSWQHISITWTEGGQSGTESYEAQKIVYEFQEDGQFINPFVGGFGIWEVENNILIIRNSGFGSKPERRNIKEKQAEHIEQYVVKKITNTTLQLFREDKEYQESVLFTFKRV